jgi:hypothetical protein
MTQQHGSRVAISRCARSRYQRQAGSGARSTLSIVESGSTPSIRHRALATASSSSASVFTPLHEPRRDPPQLSGPGPTLRAPAATAQKAGQLPRRTISTMRSSSGLACSTSASSSVYDALQARYPRLQLNCVSFDIATLRRTSVISSRRSSNCLPICPSRHQRPHRTTSPSAPRHAQPVVANGCTPRTPLRRRRQDSELSVGQGFEQVTPRRS